MDNDANLHGSETPDALASSATPAEKTLMNEGMNAIHSASKGISDLADKTGLTKVADDAGVEKGTTAAVQSYGAEEVSLTNEERPT